MKKSHVVIWIGLLGVLLLSSTVWAAHGKEDGVRKAILLAAFGTTVPEAQKALDQVEHRVKQEYPAVEVRWAYTSGMVRKKLAKAGKMTDSPEMALARLMDDGFTHVAVLSLHTIPGIEFHELAQNARLFGQMVDGFQKVSVAWPLLSSRDDHVRVAKAMIRQIPAGRKAQDAVLLMGHGSEHHPSDAIYSAMNEVFHDLDPNVHVATVDGYPQLEDVLPKLEAGKVRKVYLMPLMAVAGDHARNDMAGDDPDSWKSVLKSKGYQCEAVLKGTAEYPELVDVWVDHLKTAMQRLE